MRWFSAAVVLLCAACSPRGTADSTPSPDAAVTQIARDAGLVDASVPDASRPDAAERTDAAIPDPVDAGQVTILADAGPGSWRSALYPLVWEPGFSDGDGRALQDYSYAGYHHGEEPPLITAGIRSVVEDGADPTGAADSTMAIQATITAVSAEGGVVFFPAGTYTIAGQLQVRASNVVLRGEGPATRLRFTMVGPEFGGQLVAGSGPTHADEQLLIEDGARFSTLVKVADASMFAAGDTVAVGHVITDQFLSDHAMTGTWMAFNGTWQPFYRRTIVAVDGNSVALDVPLRDPVLTRDAASLRRENGILREVGIEDLSFSNAVAEDDAWGVDQVSAVIMQGLEDSWIRRVTTFAGTGADHVQSNGITIIHSKRMTVADCALGKAQNRGGGGNGYLFEIRQSSEVLTRDCTATAGRHNFIQNWGFGTTGCVWLRVVSREGRNLFAQWDPIGAVGPSEFHHSLATANLIDSSQIDDGWAAGNRGSESSGAGHSASENVFWNVRGAELIRSLQYGHGYVIGTQGVTVTTALSYQSIGLSARKTAPEDMLEGAGMGATLAPGSLYEDQRARRMAH